MKKVFRYEIFPKVNALAVLALLFPPRLKYISGSIAEIF